MSKITRILSLFLCCVMLLTCLPVTSGAEEALATASDLTAGDFITFGTFNEHPLLWRVVANDGEKIKLFCAETLFSGEIDASMHEVLAYANLVGGAWEGDSNWHTSDIRTYLNSDAETVTYKGASVNELPSYSARAGFLTNFSESELGVMQEITHKSHTQYHRTLTDKDGGSGFARIEMFSNIIEYDEEAYENLSYLNVTERVFLPDAKDLKEASEALNGSHLMKFAYNDSTGSYYAPTNRDNFWLREPVIYGSSYLFWGMFFLDTTEAMDYCGYATFKRAIKPMCYIQLEPTQTLSGDGTLASPYALSDETGSTGDGIQLISRSPENGGTFEGDNLVVSMTFNHEVEAVNTGLTHGNFSIVRQIEEADSWKFKTVYSLSEGDHLENDVTIEGNTVKIDVSSATLISGEIYYIHMDTGVITFKDTNETIGFGGTEWTFTTGFVSQGEYEGVYGSRFSYSDTFFLGGNSDVYNHSLAIASCNLAISAYNNPEAKNTKDYPSYIAGKNVKNMLIQLGFDEDNIDISSYGGKPTTASIASAIATKKLNVESEDWTLLTIAIRGGEYEAEWGGNFWVGQSDDHIGFLDASNQVKNNLRDYLKKHPIEGNVAVWITGYSRAAATANLLSASLNTKSDLAHVGLNADSKNIYTYTFETPMGAINSETNSHNNIFNLVNPIDFVTKVAPSEWNFGRYGVDCFFPNMSTTKEYASYIKSVEQYYTQFSGKSLPNEFTAYKLSFDDFIHMINDIDGSSQNHGYFLDEFISDGVCTDFLQSRQQYCDELQSTVMEALSFFMSGAKINKYALVDEVLTDIAETVRDEFIKKGIIKVAKHADGSAYAVVTVLEIASKLTGYERRQLANNIAELLVKAKVVNLPVDEVSDCLYKLLDKGRWLEFIAKHFNEVYTLIMNGNWIRTAHEPQYCLAWMLAIADNYQEAFANGGKYRVLTVNCPVDVRVYDSENNLVAAIVNDAVQTITNSTIGTLNDENEQKIVVLPSDEQYRIEVTATGNGSMTYSVAEYDMSLGKYVRVVNYFDVELEESANYTGIIENLIDTDAAYPLLTDSGERIPVDEDLSGNDIVRYTVDVTYAGDGVVSGGGKFNRGEYALVTAIPDENCDFEGWYSNDKLVSLDSEYRFCVTSDITLTAKFTAAEEIPVVPGNPITTTPTVPTPETPFVDVPDDSYYQDAVIWASEEGITTGTSAVSFSPDASCTRAQAVTFLWRAAGSPAPRSTEMPFADVPTGAYYYDAVLWAVENGITTGTGDTTFSPNATCTRGQIVTFLWRTRNAPAVTAANPFADVAEDAYYRQAVLWAVKESVTTGTSATTFSPDADCTRAQIVTFLYRTFAK